MTRSWLDEARTADLSSIMERAGLTRRHKRWGPCPACNAARTGSDRRPPVRIIADGLGWRCYSCSVTGDVIDLASYTVAGSRFRDAGTRWEDVRDFFGLGVELPKRESKPRTITRPPVDEIMSIIKAGTVLSETDDKEVLDFVGRRHIPIAAPASVLPISTWSGWSSLTRVQYDDRETPWWPWRNQFRLVVPAFDWRGEVANMHGRDVTGKATRKTTWPLGCDAAGVAFADKRGRALLRGDADGTHTLWVVEGVTDFLMIAGARVPGFATIGCAAGGVGALEGLGAFLATLEFNRAVRVLTCPDSNPGGAGEKHTQGVIDALAPTRVHRMRLDVFNDRKAA